MSDEQEAAPAMASSQPETEASNANDVPSTSANAKDGDTAHEDEARARFECNICLDTATDAVISLCGHLFCWPCLHQWLDTRPNRQMCPVCKSAISREKVIPLYGRGSGANQVDPREKQVPPRPQGQRHEPANHSVFPGLWGGGGGAGGDAGIHFSFGIGAFPFSVFASSLNFGDPRPAAPPVGSRQYEEEQRISSVFIWIAVIFFVWLLLS